MELPDLQLSYGQLLWATNYGREPDRIMKDQVRYLRLLDIPMAAAKRASGSGTRIPYDFFDLMELGLAVTALNLGFRPREISAGLVRNRAKMRLHYVDAWTEIPEPVLHDPWVKSRGRIKPMFGEELFVRLHNRRSENFGQIDFVSEAEATDDMPILEPIERFETGQPRRLIPLKRLMIQWVVWAQEAPATKPGPAGREG